MWEDCVGWWVGKCFVSFKILGAWGFGFFIVIVGYEFVWVFREVGFGF